MWGPLYHEEEKKNFERTGPSGKTGVELIKFTLVKV